MDDYGKIGYNRLVKYAAKRENASGSHLSSSSVKDCRLRARQKVVVRVPSRVGVTGGYSEGAQADSSYMKKAKKATPPNPNKLSRAEKIGYLRSVNGRLAR
jgi:hypothetical protein